MAMLDLGALIANLRQQAANARAQAEQDRRARRQENDRWVTAGVHWDGYGLETLIKMVAERASPNQLDSLAGEWRRHGGSVAQASTDLQTSLNGLMNYWSGATADEARQIVTTNAQWMSELGQTAQQMGSPIEDASGALRSAQSTMPGKPHDAWYAGAGGGALAGFAIGGPVGAAFGAAIGGIASAFGFGSNKKKLKRKAVQTMQRYESALLGVDGTTPQFGLPADGVNPGTGQPGNPGGGVGTPGAPYVPPGGTGPVLTPPGSDFDIGTAPSLADGGAENRWRAITNPPGVGGVGPVGGGGGGLPPTGIGGLPGGLRPPPGRGGPGGRGGLGGAVPGRGGVGAGAGTGRGGRGGAGVGRGMVPGGGLGGAGRGGAAAGRGGRGGTSAAGAGRGGAGRGGVPGGGVGAGAGRGGAGKDREHKRRPGLEMDGSEGMYDGGFGPDGSGPGGRGGIGATERGGRGGRFGRGGVLDPHGAGGYGGVGGAGARQEEDDEHVRRFPVEEDPFSSADLKAAPPVIGL
jgi:hypothetical protein